MRARAVLGSEGRRLATPLVPGVKERDAIMQFDQLADPRSAAIVVGGTVLATVLRCGLSDARAALRALVRLARPAFDPAKARAALAAHVRIMQQDGVIRAEPPHLGDRELDDATAALIGQRSIAALRAVHLLHKRCRAGRSIRAVRTFTLAADLSPVFGLAGTLVSLTQLPKSGEGDFTGAISMAVLTTLYGLVLGNIVFAPLSRMVARAAAREERARQQVLDWLEQQLVQALPTNRRPQVEAAA
ncbi:MotA/TolQ/ExbB proton channel family protein [Novosphingobium colocasiae]|uniref:Flagellar motor protein MotP n=1 Tax=Novosphingobium colocasiae TaxID=1256513 RepID=A0A918P8T9_9SPHN|nr:MotA/TolQ/ExbB proton channel family protein [Novosphingobium colocasiae]GGY92618.1 flagellar motor protein MotP [Novosphingobium colocasiae]